MSAKRRQETIAQFSVPLDAENAHGSSARRNDYVIDDDDDFIDDEEDDYASAKRNGKKKAGFSKAQGKGKARQAVDGSSFSGQNPKVMLLSLKAVRPKILLIKNPIQTLIFRELLD